MITPPPISTRTYTLFPYTTLSDLPPRCVIHLETGNPNNILETARRLCIWDNPPLAIIIAKLPRNGFTPPRDNPEILMAIDLNGLSAKELDSLITKAKARKIGRAHV